MASIVIQASKYIILFLFLGYVFGAFYVFRFGKQPEIQKKIYALQKISLFIIHGLGFYCLYLKICAHKVYAIIPSIRPKIHFRILAIIILMFLL